MSEQISSLGSNLLIVTPGSSTTSFEGLRGGFGTRADADPGRRGRPGLEREHPGRRGCRAGEARRRCRSRPRRRTGPRRVIGTTEDWPSVRARTLASGTFFTADDDASAADVVVLGSTTATELFGSTDVVGQSVTISGVDVHGGRRAGRRGCRRSTPTSTTWRSIPLTTAAEQVVGGRNRNSLSTIYVQAASTDQLSAAYQETETLLLNLHSISSVDSADFTINSQDALVSTATAVYRTLTILLTGIAALSLLVGGIGVMNIMLVSVTERTREIGLRKALGAPPWAIRRQFLTEATVLGLAGGVLGAGLGIAAARVLPSLLDTSIVVSGLAVAGSVVVAMVIGLVFGVYPATRAARLAPIDALRSE